MTTNSATDWRTDPAPWWMGFALIFIGAGFMSLSIVGTWGIDHLKTDELGDQLLLVWAWIAAVVGILFSVISWIGAALAFYSWLTNS